MVEEQSTPRKIVQFLAIVAVVAIGVLLLCLICKLTLSGSKSNRQSTATNVSGMDASDSSNVVTNGANSLFSAVDRTLGGAGEATSTAARAVTSNLAQAGSATLVGIKHVGLSTGHGVVGATKFAGNMWYHGNVLILRGIGSGVSYAGRGASSGLAFMLHLPLSFSGVILASPVSSVAIQPSDHAAVPVIDPNSAELAAARAALPATITATRPVSQIQPAVPLYPAEPLWPIHGLVTTEFGVPELPYQAVHTGIDISDGSRPGTTAVKAYRHGTVSQVIAGGGLGNHVIVDHGGGVTSVYGHLNSISVQPGQAVTTDTILGYEGTTGVSTGTHLHFEIRVNGQAANPRSFIDGQP